MSLLDILFPKQCVFCKKIGSYLCPDCFSFLSFETASICLVCGKNSFDGLTHPLCKTNYSIDGAFCGIVYGKVMKKIIYVFKYQPYVTAIAGMLTEFLYESLVQKEVCVAVLAQKPLFIPIPLSKKKFRQRGYNQSFLLASHLAKRFDCRLDDCLERIKETKPQYGLKKEERKENVHGAFAIKKRCHIDESSVVLIDDILTTGATLSEAAAVLKRSGVKKVYAITLARDQ